VAIDLELQIASDAKMLPHPSQFREWISVSLGERVETDVELTIRIVDTAEMKEYNKKYRNKNKPTNVLSFPGEIREDLEYNYLGDIIICAPVIEEEARKTNKDLVAHWAHIVIHGALHLIGFDHKEKAEAVVMERLETQILIMLGYPPPYGAKIKHG
jgi:probable rRNA maturation factor